MRKTLLLGMGVAMLARAWGPLYAQEERESAELYLEEYTDAFQENFFEGLKQKGIGNPDRAIAHFMKCKQLEPDNAVVDYELAKAHYQAKGYVEAQSYALDALRALPGEYWVLEQLVSIMDAQGIPLEAIQGDLPYDHLALRENLAQIYFKKGRYQAALGLLDGMGDSVLKEQLARKIGDSLKGAPEVEAPLAEPGPTRGGDPLTAMRSALEGLIASGDAKALLELSREALDNYPMQPYFYYAHGTALNLSGDPAKALDVLSSGLDVLLDDVPLRNNIYREMARAHTLLGQPGKAKEYTDRINNGS